MIDLALENSTETGSLALARDGELLREWTFRGSRELGLSVAEAKRVAGSWDRVVVGVGPGSYTGLRVAAALGSGLQLATGSQLLGCPSVLGFPEADYVVVGNARRGAFFFAAVRVRRLVDGPRLVPLADVPAALARCGDLARLAVTAAPAEWAMTWAVPTAAPLLRAQESWLPSVQPLYLKEPHVTTPRGG